MTDATTKKLLETDRLATAYLQSLYRLLPCLDLESVEQERVMQDITTGMTELTRRQNRLHRAFTNGFPSERTLSMQASQVQASLHLLDHIGSNPPLEDLKSHALSEDERIELTELVNKHGFYVAREDGDSDIIITHDLIQGRARALNEREVYEIVKDTVERIDKPYV